MAEVYGTAGIGNITPATLRDQDPVFQELVLNLITIHVVSELYGADCFERSILRAPTPEFRMLMARTVMEEYGHHLRFRKLLEELGIDWHASTKDKPHLTTFDVGIESWADQVVFLALVDRAAAHQFRHFVNSPYEPFRIACRETLKEEYGHVGLGMEGVADLLKTAPGRREVEAVLPKWLAVGLQSFGGDHSKKSALYRHWGFKTEANAAMRQAYYAQVHGFVTRDWRIELPETLSAVWQSGAGDADEVVAAM